MIASVGNPQAMELEFSSRILDENPIIKELVLQDLILIPRSEIGFG
jgi:hypothetical protein